MSKSEIAKMIYKILTSYETSKKLKNQDYCVYLNRIQVLFTGLVNSGKVKEEILETINGLCVIGMGIDHKTLKAVVFHMNNLLE